MKSIFMCVNYPKYNPAIGISKKIKSQIQAFRKLGYDVTYSAYLDSGIGIYTNDRIVWESKYPSKILLNALRRFYLMIACIKFLRGRENFDLAFIRWDALDHFYFKVLQMLNDNCGKILMDFHGYFPGMKPSSIKGLYIWLSTKIFGYKLKKYIDFGIGETTHDKLFGIDIMTIDTGIDIDIYNPHCYVGNKDEINMVSVANETVYHGYDRIITGLYNYYKIKPNLKIYLHLVGNISQKTINLINKLHLKDVVVLYGYKSGDELTKIYNKCNIGVGPLAPHRIGGKEGTGIKTKEYFAIGLPYFYAGNELLVPIGFPYTHRISATNQDVDIQEIIHFYYCLQNYKNIQENMRSFARTNFSWFKIFEKTLSKMY